MKRKPQYQIKLSQLRILRAIAEAGSFSEAALRLEMSQSAISSAIAGLETALGVELFLRGRHGAILTPIGQQVLQYATQIFELLDGMVQDAASTRSLEGGQVRVSSFRSVSAHILPEVIARFRLQFPQIPVQVIEHADDISIAEDLRKGRADLGFVERLLDDEFEAWPLFQDEYVILLPADYAQPAAMSWQQLSQYPLIMGPEEFDRHIYAHCAAHGEPLQVVAMLKEDSTIVNMVAKGLGATIIPRLAAEPLPETVQVYNLPVPLFRTIQVAGLANALQTPGVYAFLELLRRYCKTERQTEQPEG